MGNDLINHWKWIVMAVLHAETKLRREGKLKVTLDDTLEQAFERWCEEIAKEILKTQEKDGNTGNR